jgi:hypothetical protein
MGTDVDTVNPHNADCTASSVLILVGNNKAAKNWTSDSTGALANSYLHTPHERRFDTLDDVACLLKKLEDQKNAFIVRGALTPAALDAHTGGGKIRRLIHDQKDDTGNTVPATLRDDPKSWVCFDIDGITTPIDAVSDTAAALAWAIDTHLQFLRGVGVVYKLSGSAGHPKKDRFELRVHVYAMLTEARTCAQLRAWANGSGIHKSVDRALFSANQIHYTAAPITNGIGARPASAIGRIDGGALSVPVVVDAAPAKKAAKAHTVAQIERIASAGMFATAADKSAAQNELATRCQKIARQGAGNRNAVLNAHAWHVYGAVAAGLLTDQEATAALQSAGQACGLAYDEIATVLHHKRRHHAPAKAHDDDALIDALDSVLSTDDTPPAIVTAAQAWAALAAYNDVLAEFKSEKTKTRGAIDDRLTTAQLQGGALFALLLDRAQQVPIVYPTIDTALCVDDLKHGCDDVTAAYLAALVRRRYDDKHRRLAAGLAISDDQKKTIHTLDDAAYTLPTGITALRAAMGSGKTAFVGREWRRFAEDHDLQFLAITHRAALCTESARVLDCTNYATAASAVASGVPSEKVYKNIAACINSIDRPDIRENVKMPDVVVIDEVSQLRRAWGAVYHKDTGTANGSNPAATYKRFCDIVKQAAHVLVLDAALSDDDLQWLRGIRDEITVLEHKKKSGDGLNVNFKYAFNVGAKMASFDEIVYRLREGHRIWVSVAEKRHGTALMKHIKNTLGDIKTLFVHAQTPTKVKNEILADVDAASKRVQLFIASPTISSGISVTHADGAHFDAVYVIGNGSGAGVDDIIQMLRRVRYATDLNVCVWQTDSPIQIDDAQLLLDVGRSDESAQIDDLYTLAQTVKARRNFERRNFIFALATGLQLAGFAINCTKTGGNCKALGQLNDQITVDDVERLNNARRLNFFDYDEVKAKRSKTAADYDALDAFELRDHLNIHDRQITADDVELWQGGHGREWLARIAALHGRTVGNRENSHTLVRLYSVIFNGIELSDFIDGDKVTITPDFARRIVDNAWGVGREGVAHGLLPDSYRSRKKASARPVATAVRILELAGILSVSLTLIIQKVRLTDSKRVLVQTYTGAQLQNRISAALRLSDAQHDTTPEKDRVTHRPASPSSQVAVIAKNPKPIAAAAPTNTPAYIAYMLLFKEIAPRKAALNDKQARIGHPAHEWLELLTAAGMDADRVCAALIAAGLVEIGGSYAFIKRDLNDAPNDPAFKKVGLTDSKKCKEVGLTDTLGAFF